MAKKYLCVLAVAAAAATPVLANNALKQDDFSVECVSDVDGSNVTLKRSGGSDKGHLSTGDLEGEAAIYPVGESMTFLLMQDGQVVTFVVNYDSLKYDMMVKGAVQKFDRGTCPVS
ncbi:MULTISPECIES: hypothetical protein [unclassified Ruegeria]|uniref:hypothetical protein n=1 Tax=unclassified Ruegeria TaxID=2625375 RepID=UPI00148776E1|nr:MULTISPECIES: hypothetical protein [unclassified Ruegeria]NOD63417.1 hypothetical protein [Ruegeria sp. HKCCD6109]